MSFDESLLQALHSMSRKTDEGAAMKTPEAPCTRCDGTGTTSSSSHPQCGTCYGTGIAGMTLTRIEAERKQA